MVSWSLLFLRPPEGEHHVHGTAEAGHHGNPTTERHSARCETWNIDVRLRTVKHVSHNRGLSGRCARRRAAPGPHNRATESSGANTHRHLESRAAGGPAGSRFQP